MDGGFDAVDERVARQVATSHMIERQPTTSSLFLRHQARRLRGMGAYKTISTQPAR